MKIKYKEKYQKGGKSEGKKFNTYLNHSTDLNQIEM